MNKIKEAKFCPSSTQNCKLGVHFGTYVSNFALIKKKSKWKKYDKYDNINKYISKR